MKPTLILLPVLAVSIAIPVAADLSPESPAPSTLPSVSSPSNAADLYRHAFTLLDALDDADRQRLGMCGVEGCWVVTTPLDQSTADLIARQKQAINLARTAAAMPEARWNLNGDAGKMTELANHVPRLSALLVLQARHELQAGERQQALDDLMVALALTRHAAADWTLLCKVVEISAQRPAVEVLAQQLPGLPRELLATLPARFKQLPDSPTMRQVILGEHQFAKNVAARQGIVVAVMVGGLNEFYTTLANGGSLSPTQFASLVDEQTAKFSANPWAKLLGPQLKKARETIAAAEARQAMFMTAIDILLQGEAAVAASKDPFDTGPFGYRKLPHGFELSSKLIFRGQPVKLRVGD